MSAAAALPSPPQGVESNTLEPKPQKKNKTKLLSGRNWSRTQSPKVTAPAQEPTRKSFIWPWLEGKLEKRPSSFSSEGSSSSFSPRASDSVPMLAPMPVSAVMPQNQPNMSGFFADAATELIALYDPFCNQWYYISLQMYNAMFGQNKEEELSPEEDKKVEENVKKENIKDKEVQVDLPKQMTPKFKIIHIGEIEVQVPLKNFEQANENLSGLASSSSSTTNVQDGTAKEEADKLPRVVEHGQQSDITGQKKGKKKKNKGKKK